MINRVTVIGRLTKDADLRYTPNGTAVAAFTIASERSFSNQDGNRETDFIPCVTWRKQAENLANFTKKGCMVAVDGRIQTRNYEGQDGKRVYVTEILAESIQFLEFKRAKKTEGSLPDESSSNGSSNPREYYDKERKNYDTYDPHDPKIDISDDDLPF